MFFLKNKVLKSIKQFLFYGMFPPVFILVNKQQILLLQIFHKNIYYLKF